jgi:hypothetical protein
MCLACEQEDLYFLYLERIEQARRAARGEQAKPNAGWMWGNAAPAASSAVPAAAAPAPAPRGTTAFVCDAPDGE